ncbi:putative toxin-antitoxin system toxin component, PIN family [Mesorhizobium albiziae]|uniref:Putative toxin-antitoxin system toxin component, PIN family n=1 Tax=Neomesorhizobium albiziae TaxID=335020 RepID=A0A1I3VAW0_9HYPH|nr:putative toxin-antitoxin system toxin component, PIN family [Mesorhizobium albiziae]GLS28779.1 PIN domain-containing protein [Mesorhizobium albiziae]SFJ92332.1 putative toxin-antitoxin system toxin component, PIN family [Mesorhizobium albiziae]
MKRVVLDTNVLAAGLRSSSGASFAILRLVAERRLRPLVTTALFLEYEDVLSRPEQREANGLSVQQVAELMAEFAALAEPVEVHFLWRPQVADPKDEMVLEAAVNGRADALVTHNVRDFLGVAERFDIKALRPRDFLKGMRL